MPTWVSDQINTIYSGVLGGTATAGVAGGPIFPRATEIRGIFKVYRFTVEAATPNPIPGQAAGSLAAGDTLVLAWLNPTERIYFGRVYFNAWTAGLTLSVGKLDKNNAANTDAVHYKAATSVAAAGTYDLDTNMTEQVGADPLGDQTTGNLIPMFGSDKVWITATIAGGTPAAGSTLTGFIMVVEEGN